MPTHERPSRPQPSRPEKKKSSAHRFKALATDYDGTLADDGKVSAETLVALRRLKKTGRKLLLVTGRELDDLMRTFPNVDVFDIVVAENGALLYTPRPHPPRERPLVAPPPPEFVRTLIQRGVEPISSGRIIVATWEPHHKVVLETIHDLGLELEVIFNKGAVMVLPSGINKATGLCAALVDLGIDAHDVIGVGDAENDHSLLGACGLGVAVANAVPALKKRAHLVTDCARGAGVVELVEELLRTDFADLVHAQPGATTDSIPPELESATRLATKKSPQKSTTGGHPGRPPRPPRSSA
ncbi:MAG TPA: HAD family hydrolase [Labilithrix sp.]|nr:HAD family hydrolase [Labilithrix sp.]